MVSEMSKFSKISIKGARVNNLKNVSVELPLNKIICITGPSGSGKTSLAFHTVLAESKRRFLNSFPNYLKFFSDRPSAVDVDEIFPVMPVFGLPQINPVISSRQTAMDISRLSELLQNLFYMASKSICPVHNCILEEASFDDQLLEFLQKNYAKAKSVRVFLSSSYYQRCYGVDSFPVRSFDGKELREFNIEDPYYEILRIKPDAVKKVSKLCSEDNINKGQLYFWTEGQKKLKEISFKLSHKCPKCDYQVESVDYRLGEYSAFNPLGACSECNGHGANLIYDEKKLFDNEKSINDGAMRILEYSPFHTNREYFKQECKKKKFKITLPLQQQPEDFWNLVWQGSGKFVGISKLLSYLDRKKYKRSVRIYIRKIQKEVVCESCNGLRIKAKVHGQALVSNDKVVKYSSVLDSKFEEAQQLIDSFKFSDKQLEKKRLKISSIFSTINSIGLGHLSMLRKLKSVSPGEYQRLLLVKYLSYDGTDALFVFDEPSLGLDLSEQKLLLKSFVDLTKQKNTVLLVDHSSYFQENCDKLIVMGPDSGHEGGEISYYGKPLKQKKIKFPKIEKRSKAKHWIKVEKIKAWGRNYKNFKIPIGQLSLVYGPCGSGKTTCITKVMADSINYQLNGEHLVDDYHSANVSFKNINDVVLISSDLNRFSSRSSVGSMSELATVVRKHFLKLPVSKAMGLKDGHLSSNSELGMCPNCEGKGHVVVEMQYLEDIHLLCEDCQGKKIKPVYAAISDGEMSVYEAFNMPLSAVLEKIELTPKFKKIRDYLKILNLDYLSLDRGITSLSGGEKQRIYLLSKLIKKPSETLFILENISFGLASKDVINMALFLRELTELGHTIVVMDKAMELTQLVDFTVDFSQMSQ